MGGRDVCPFCESVLKGHADVGDARTQVRALDCPSCGRYAYAQDAKPLIENADAALRARMARFLEFVGRKSGGAPFRLTAEHLQGGSGPA